MPVATVPDYYEVLGVSPDASTEEIRKAYLKLAHKYHPDKTGGDKAAEEKLKKINEAYDILKNPEKRRQYDEMRKMAQSGFSFEDAGFDFSRFGAEDSPFADLFEAFFAHRRPSAARQQRQRGADIEAQVQITLREAVEGTQRVVRYLRNDTCDACHGTGSADGQGPMTCPECHGAGEVTERRGVFSITQTCTRCAGTGKVLTSPCSTCHGTGTVRKPREVRVDIPAGVQDGMRLRLAGQGEVGYNGGPSGDLYVAVRLLPDEFFTRQGDDVLCEVPITVSQAALGATIRVPTLQGVAELKIPAGTQNGTTLRMRGLGFPRLGGTGKGDQLVKIRVEVPVSLTPRQRKLLEELAETNGEKIHYPQHHRFLDWLKSWYRGG